MSGLILPTKCTEECNPLNNGEKNTTYNRISYLCMETQEWACNSQVSICRYRYNTIPKLV